MMMMCQMHCGRDSVVTITVDHGNVLAHYPACALHIVEVANLVRQQSRMEIEPTPEAWRIERRGLTQQMDVLLDEADAVGEITFDQKDMLDRWMKRIGELDRLIRRHDLRQAVEATEPLRELPPIAPQ